MDANAWLEDLLDEYPTARSDAAISRLMRVFADVPAGVMRTAVDAYMRQGSFFPKIADLRPFVDTAQQRAINEGWPDGNPHGGYSDEFMYQWELERGTMRPLAEIEAEGRKAREWVGKKLAKTTALTGQMAETVTR